MQSDVVVAGFEEAENEAVRQITIQNIARRGWKKAYVIMQRYVVVSLARLWL